MSDVPPATARATRNTHPPPFKMDCHAEGINFNEFIAAMFDAQHLAQSQVQQLVSAGRRRGRWLKGACVARRRRTHAAGATACSASPARPHASALHHTPTHTPAHTAPPAGA
jgi:hypothetical protein